MQNDYQIILDQLKELRTDVADSLRSQSAQHLEVMKAVIELQTQMTSVIGGAQPGRLSHIEERVIDLEEVKNKTIGWASLAVSIVAGLWLLAAQLVPAVGKW